MSWKTTITTTLNPTNSMDGLPLPDLDKPYLFGGLCAKCGQHDPRLWWRDYANTDSGFMTATCLRCGYEWRIEPLDDDTTQPDGEHT